MLPAKRPLHDPRSGAWRRHHVYPQTVQCQVKDAVRVAGVAKHDSRHTFRHGLATQLLERGHDIRTVQELPHVMCQGVNAVKIPLDR